MEKQSNGALSEQPGRSTTLTETNRAAPSDPICQICGGRLMEIRAKLVCERCHTIWETCCEGGRG